jgi:molybdate transport system permease protein
MLSLSAEEWEILRLSLKVALWSVAGSLPFALAAAYALARASFPGKSVFDAAVHLPLVLPPVVIGYFLLLLLGRRGPLGSLLEQVFGIVFSFRWTGAALACAVMGFPLMVRAIRLSLETVDEKLEAAARTLGAGRVRVLATITLPLALPGVITGMLLSFARGLGEFGATITFVSNIPGETRTLPLAIYTYTQVPDGDPFAMRLSLMAVVVSLAALLVSEVMARRATAAMKGRDAAN